MKSRLSKLIASYAEANDALKIVDLTIVDRLLDFVPADILQQFFDAELNTAPKPDDPLFADWVKASRKRMRLTQKGFADSLRDLGHLKISASDIGNLEVNHRRALYTQKRLEKIRTAIIICSAKMSSNPTNDGAM